jgi:hypothetical protein
MSNDMIQTALLHPQVLHLLLLYITFRLFSTTQKLNFGFASFFLQESKNGWRQSEADDPLPFFTLSDLWGSFRECSAYGTAVPIVLNGCRDEIVQYYVPYLSAIQLYGGIRRHVGPSRYVIALCFFGDEHSVLVELLCSV